MRAVLVLLLVFAFWQPELPGSNRVSEPGFARALSVAGLTRVDNDAAAWHAVEGLISAAGGACRDDGYRYTLTATPEAPNAFWDEAERISYGMTVTAAINMRGPWPALHVDAVNPSTEWELWRGRTSGGTTFYALWEGEGHTTLYACAGPFYVAPRSRHSTADVRVLCREAVSSRLLVPRSARWGATTDPVWDAERLQWRHVLRVESQNAFGVMIPHTWECVLPEGRSPVVTLL